MAKTRLSKCAFVEHGYGQVEENHLSARRTGQIYAQLPAAASIEILENGQFAKYNAAEGVVDFSVDGGEWMLVLNEIKNYENRKFADDFAMIKVNYGTPIRQAVSYAPMGDGYVGVFDAANNLMPENISMVPRLLKTNIGDLFTTNTIKEESLKLKDVLKVGEDGYLSKSGTSDMEWQVVKVYTMPDGERGVKIKRIK